MPWKCSTNRSRAELSPHSRFRLLPARPIHRIIATFPEGVPMRYLNQYVCAAVLPVALALLSSAPARGQGCIVARSSSLDMSPQSQGGYLEAGEWDRTGRSLPQLPPKDHMRSKSTY